MANVTWCGRFCRKSLLRVSQVSRRIGSGPGGEFPPGESLVIRCSKPESSAEVRLNPRG